jgi:hypothetical protein
VQIQLVEEGARLLQGLDGVRVVGVVEQVVDVHVADLEDARGRAVEDVELVVVPHRRLARAPRICQHLDLLLQAPACMLAWRCELHHFSVCRM